MKKYLKWIIASSVLVVIIIGIVVFNNIKNNKKEEKTTYTTIKVTKPTPFTLTGKIESKTIQALQNPSGKVKNVNIMDGQHLNQGDVILQTYSETTQESIDDVRLQIVKSQRELNAAKSNIDNLNSQLHKVDKDSESYNNIKEQLQTAKVTQDNLKDVIADSNRKLENLLIKVNATLNAPYSGIVSLKNERQDAPVITLYSDDKRAVGQISEYDYAKVKQNEEVTIYSLANNVKQNAKVTSISQIPSQGSKNNDAKYNILVDVDGNRFMNGQTIRISVPQKNIKIPKSSVYKGKVFIVIDKKAFSKKVSGSEVNGFFEVKEGIKEGQRVITNPDSKLKDGKKVS